MRFIVKEQDYEKPIAAGLFRYMLDGVNTGATEQWRLTQALDGYEVLRVDLDAREAESGHSYLYHLVRQVDGTPERLAYRFWGEGLQIAGTLLFSETNITGTRSVNGRTHPEDLEIEPNTPFWFPSAIGLGLMATLGDVVGQTAVTLNGKVDGQDTLALQQVTVDVVAQETVEIEVARQRVTAVSTQIQWNGHERIILCDKNSWPVGMQRPHFMDDKLLTAKEVHNIWY